MKNKTINIRDIIIDPDSWNAKIYKHWQLIKTNDWFIRIVYNLNK